MGDFYYVEFEQLRGELLLSPLPQHARQVMNLLLAGETIGPEECDRSMEAAVLRLAELGLVDDLAPMGWGWDHTGRFAPTLLLEAIVDRGMLDTLFEAAS